VANGEILSVTLMMEDLLTITAKNEIASEQFTNSSEMNLVADSQLSILSTNTDQNNQAKKQTCKLINNYKRWHFFLTTWKRLEVLKLVWGRRKLAVDNINNFELLSRFK
jgi:hypothetical protein